MLEQVQDWLVRYKSLVRSRAIPWRTALILGTSWGLLSWMMFPFFFNPIAAISTLRYPFGWFNLIFNVVMGATVGTVLVRLAGALLPYVAPLVAVTLTAYLLALIGLIRIGQMFFVFSVVLSTVIILVWWKYIFDTRPEHCGTCGGRGLVGISSYDGTEDEMTCGVCGGSGALTRQQMSIKLTPIFLIMLFLILGFGLSALNWSK